TLRSHVNRPSSPEVFAVRVEHRTNAFVMSIPGSETCVAVELFGRLAVPLVTALRTAPSPGAEPRQTRVTKAASAVSFRRVRTSNATMPARAWSKGYAKLPRGQASITIPRIGVGVSNDQARVWGTPRPMSAF